MVEWGWVRVVGRRVFQEHPLAEEAGRSIRAPMARGRNLMMRGRCPVSTGTCCPSSSSQARQAGCTLWKLMNACTAPSKVATSSSGPNACSQRDTAPLPGKMQTVRSLWDHSIRHAPQRLSENHTQDVATHSPWKGVWRYRRKDRGPVEVIWRCLEPCASQQAACGGSLCPSV